MSEFALDPAATVGPVALTVQSLERTLYLYRDILGMEALPAEDADLTLAVDGVPLFRLTANRVAHKRSPRTTGLFHAAILTPSRLDLARTLMRLFESDYPLQGAADHLVSEALYLADPDGNGLEIYADRPRAQWPYVGQQVQMTTDPLDMEGLLALLKKDNQRWKGLAAGTHIGHVHLQVNDIRQAEAFYCGVLGFDLMQRYGPSALFASVGGYHHHLGMNTWNSLGASPPPLDTIGLRYFTINLPDAAQRQLVAARLAEKQIEFSERPDGLFLHDPAGNGVLIQ